MLEALIVLLFSFSSITFVALLGSQQQSNAQKASVHNDNELEKRPYSYQSESKKSENEPRNYDAQVGKLFIRAVSCGLLVWANVSLGGIVSELDNALQRHGSLVIEQSNSSFAFFAITAMPASFLGTRLWGKRGFFAFLVSIGLGLFIGFLVLADSSESNAVSNFSTYAWMILFVPLLYLLKRFWASK